MNTLKKSLSWLAFLVITIILFAGWYVMTYSMNFKEEYEINPVDYVDQVLIATQSSKYKNAVEENVVQALKDRPVRIKVIDVTGLSEINPDDWTAIIILHTWEMYKPPVSVHDFIESNYDGDKMFFITTSGDGDKKVDIVDGVTGASRMEEVPEHTEAILSFLEKKLTPLETLNQ